MTRHVIGSVEELGSGGTRVVEIGGRSIGIYNVEGRLYALRNVCPHHGAPLCAGAVEGRMLPSNPHEYVYSEETTVVRCPWHGYEFRLEDGRSTLNPETLRVKSYRVEVEGEEVALYV